MAEVSIFLGYSDFVGEVKTYQTCFPLVAGKVGLGWAEFPKVVSSFVFFALTGIDNLAASNRLPFLAPGDYDIEESEVPDSSKTRKDL